MKSEKFLETAVQLACEAGREVMKLRQGPISKRQKVDRSLVTEADLRSDQILREGLAKAFPEHTLITEENGISGRTGSDWTWLVDPLDGTKAFAEGIAGFSILVGLLKEGRPYLGVVVDPMENRVYEAVRGEGAYLISGQKRSRLSVSKRDQFEKMPVVVSTGFPPDRMARLREALETPLLEPINSVGIKAGMVVRQEADIYISHHLVHYWDTCAPQVIVEEAGGSFTRLDGRHLTYDLSANHAHDSLPLVSNGTRHGELGALLSKILA